ncbi:hypothetical protein GpartN1_g5497.t1 [Galdieria partita]|uniref:UBC core domain-containing protein n=1 Tax=Galdieria partita TaxID=83374 RepID=A0A9C7US62_9RHOD|nr:hypothetical protein GpartN1_g5497.t1 [Galdieria partita]
MAAQTCVHRLTQELKRLQKDPPQYIHVVPCPKNFLTWYFVLEGPPETCYEGGVYLGKLIFPKEFPYKPPAIYLCTPNGRLQTDTRLCLSMSDFHPETWNPLWSTAAVLNGLLSFMVSEETSMNTLKTSLQERRRLALLSHRFNAQSKTFCQLFPEWIRQDLDNSALLLEKQPRPTPRIENPISKLFWTATLLVFLGFVLLYLN